MYIRPADPKPLLWVGSTRDALRELPTTVRKELGIDLRLLQSGEMPRDWKPMSQVGSGVFEIRVRVGGAFRLIYVAKFTEGIYVLHVFQMTERIRRSSGNVFKDLGFPPDEAAHMLIRTDLMLEIKRILKERRLTQVKAAKLLGVSQPRVSDLVRARIDLFSIDTLVALLARLGVSVSLRTRRSRRVA